MYRSTHLWNDFQTWSILNTLEMNNSNQSVENEHWSKKLFFRITLPHICVIVHSFASFKHQIHGIGSSSSNTVWKDGLESGNLIEGLLEGVAQSLAGGADKGSNGLGLGFSSTFNAVIN